MLLLDQMSTEGFLCWMLIVDVEVLEKKCSFFLLWALCAVIEAVQTAATNEKKACLKQQVQFYLLKV